MTNKLRVAGKPQVNTKRKLRRFQEALAAERAVPKGWLPPERLQRSGKKVDEVLRGTA